MPWAQTRRYASPPRLAPRTTLYAAPLPWVSSGWTTSPPPPPRSPHLGGPHHPSPRWDPILARPPRAPSRPLTSLVPAGPPTLAGRPGSHTPRAILAPDERIGELGMGWHPPGPHLPPGTERSHLATLGRPAYVPGRPALNLPHRPHLHFDDYRLHNSLLTSSNCPPCAQ